MNRLFLLLFGAVTFVAHAQVPDYVPTEGLVAWYPFNGNANDESGNGNDGVATNTVLTTDRFEEDAAFAFNGINSHIRIEHSDELNLLGDFTISIWFLDTNPPPTSNNHTLIAKRDDGGMCCSPEVPWHCALNYQQNGTDYQKPLFVAAAGGSYTFSQADFEIFLNEWQHLVLTYSEDTLKMHLDGSNIHSNYVNPVNRGSNSDDMLIGMPNREEGAEVMEGKIDDIGIWNRALTEEEILALYNAPAPTPGCTDPTACNFDAEATSDDGSCIPSGCMEPLACNYNALAECEGVACDYACCPGPGCCGPGTVWDEALEYCIPMDASCPQDLDFDGVVGVNDLMDLLSAFGTDCAPVEEPETSEFTCGDPVSYHGYDYATVQIGEQCWFAENLRTEHYTNGDAIPANLSDSEWSSTTSGAVAVYGEDAGCENNSPDGDACDPVWSLNEYGRLYNWYAVDDERGLCPTGWHVPTDGEWMTLEMELGMSESDANNEGWRGTDQGTQIKTTYGWHFFGNGTNSSGFSGLPGGVRNSNGYFHSTGYSCYWWSSSPSGSYAWARYLYYDYPNVYRYNTIQRLGFSVRCLKDAE